jgi:hypothetical protein
MARINIRRSTTVDSLYRGRTPTDQAISDKENRTPEGDVQQSNSMAPPKGLPEHINKRRRLETQSIDRAWTPMTQFLSQNPLDEEEDETRKYYDPDQDPAVRRVLRIEMSRTHREIQGERYIAAGESC